MLLYTIQSHPSSKFFIVFLKEKIEKPYLSTFGFFNRHYNFSAMKKPWANTEYCIKITYP